eukprot:CAMPEP_0194223680 /NCGR_PEP_ID=MMETSP0156-20130528/35711_1 /TAXON_ID=33649 /ORGANISM="Thalassionema nitzschioides, Strain L26-B" /LENGTH=211 /DNA_ID=CAMNT_0038954917 /DNA_START=260 /DNA_END=895 /DNA_ORIENTATION=+
MMVKGGAKEDIDGGKNPQLCFLGNENLMKKQTGVLLEEIKSDAFQLQLTMLRKAMKHYGGIGIAAPQVGWRTRVFCFGIEQNNPRYAKANPIPFTYWMNPEIIWFSNETNWMWEGCLSVPGMRGWVERPAEIILTGFDENGKPREERMDGLSARIAQHELDHLDGILFPQRVSSTKYLIPQASIDAKDSWTKDWPSPGSYKTLLGELCDDK